MAKQVHKFSFGKSGKIEILLPSGAQPVMANIDRRGKFCLWIEGDFASNQKYWNLRFFAAYPSNKDIPGNAHHAGSTVDDTDGTALHCYDITDWIKHAVPSQSVS